MRIYHIALRYVLRNKSLFLSLVMISFLLMVSLHYMFILSTPENNIFIDNFIRGYRPHFLFVLGGVYEDVDYSNLVESYKDLNVMVFTSIPKRDNDMYNKNVTTALGFLQLSSKEGEYLEVILSMFSPASFGFQPISKTSSSIFIVSNSQLSKNLSIYLESRLGDEAIVGLMQTSIDDPFLLGGEYDYDYLWIVTNNSSEVDFLISLLRDFVERSPSISMYNRSAMYIAVNYDEIPFDTKDLQEFFDEIYNDIVEFYLSFTLSIDAAPSNGSIIKVFIEQPDETPFMRPPKYNLIITHEGILRNLVLLSRSGGEILFYLSNVFISILFPIISLLIGIINRLRSDLSQVNRVVLFRGFSTNVTFPITGFLFMFSYIASSLIYMSLSGLYGAMTLSFPNLLVILGVPLIIALYAVKVEVQNIGISRKLFLSSFIIFLVVSIPGIIRISFMEILFTYTFLIPIYLFSIPLFPLTLLIIYLFIFSHGHIIVKSVWRDYFNSYPVRLWESNKYLNLMKIGVFSYVISFSLLGDSVSKAYLDIIGTPGMVYKLGFPRVLSLYTINQLIIFSRDIVIVLLPVLYLFYFFSMYKVLKLDEIKMKFRGVRQNVIGRFKIKVLFSHVISDILISGLGAILFLVFLEGYIGFYYGYSSPLEDVVYTPPRLLEVFLWRIMS